MKPESSIPSYHADMLSSKSRLTYQANQAIAKSGALETLQTKPTVSNAVARRQLIRSVIQEAMDILNDDAEGTMDFHDNVDAFVHSQ
jgi:hypothetical protein